MRGMAMPPKPPVMAKKTTAKPAAKKPMPKRAVNPSPAKKLMPGKPGMLNAPIKDKMKPLPRPSKNGGKPALKPMISRRSGF